MIYALYLIKKHPNYTEMKYLLFLIPVLVLVDLYLWTRFTALLTASSDVSVALGVVLICVTLAAHFFLYKLVKSKLK